MRRLRALGPWGLAVGLVACAGPGSILDKADARSDGDRESAASEAATILAARRGREGERVAAALVLGRLRRADNEVLAALGDGLEGEARSVRLSSAWALGELRTSESLDLLVRALRDARDVELGRALLQAMAKHRALLGQTHQRRVEVTEAMVRFGSTLPSDGRPPELDLVGGETRTLEIDVAVLGRAIEAHRARPTVDTEAALYGAALELLLRVEALGRELSSEAEVSARLDEALSSVASSYLAGEPHTASMVTWFLGQLGRRSRHARTAAAVTLAQAGTQTAGQRFLRSWTLVQTHLEALEARRALTREVLVKETDPDVLRALTAPDGAQDVLQKLLSIEVSK